MENEKELRQLFKDRSDCYTQLTEGGLKELVVEQAMTEDGFIEVLNELEHKRTGNTSTQVDNEALLEGVWAKEVMNYKKVIGDCDNCELAKWDKDGRCRYFYETKECKEDDHIYIAK